MKNQILEKKIVKNCHHYKDKKGLFTLNRSFLIFASICAILIQTKEPKNLIIEKN